jgi:glutamyl-tRNA reductase
VAQARQVAPLIAQLRDRAEEVREAELARARRRLGTLTPEQMEAVDALTRQLVAKLLHEPTVRLKADAGTASGERNAAALRDLFDLG